MFYPTVSGLRFNTGDLKSATSGLCILNSEFPTASPHIQSAIHVNRVAGDVTGGVAEEKRDGRRELAKLAKAPHRDSRENLLALGVGPLVPDRRDPLAQARTW